MSIYSLRGKIDGMRYRKSQLVKERQGVDRKRWVLRLWLWFKIDALENQIICASKQLRTNAG